MTRAVLRDSQFRVLGYIDTARDGKRTGRDRLFRVVGYFHPHTNTTVDASFRTVARGDALSALVLSRE